MSGMTTTHLHQLIYQCTQNAIHQAGVIRDLGQEAFDMLNPEEKKNIDFLLWAGCCMHKDMTTFKGGVFALKEYWKLQRVALIKLYNRDNAAAVDLAPDTAASVQADDRTKGGGACAILVTYYNLFLRFLQYVKENKASRTLNHMEKNIYDSLQCSYTQTGMCVIALYWLANILLLGPLHDHLLHFIDKLIAQPELLLASDASYEAGSLDGKLWECPEAFYAKEQKLFGFGSHLSLDQMFLRKITQEQDALGAIRAVKMKMAKHRQDVAEANIKKDAEKRAKAQAAADELARHQPFLTLMEFDFACSIP
ncbi:hypothetical protein BT96DRAFT_993635 [Gymnopus androsaceus JB14]|uniref:Uncharacterized protein n=1 Tax=Gymnopus androsaceus JB14 TaxID=1447944 RepID=A0A6A4HP10_9AGAR|nr:hypothetical protein BT96DRAFT_993635 [Gymnopus androsaceus JB14]